jgi:hypothetical protein
MRKLGIGMAMTLAWANSAAAQTAPSNGGAGPGGGGGASNGGAGAGGGNGNVVVVTQPAPQTAATPSGPIGGGNVQYSSSKPITGPNDRDGFDFGPNRQGAERGQTQYGGQNGAMFLGGGRFSGSSLASSHTVRRGDTLWDICDFYFQNPYQWPRIWSYNPQIQNPHWIYPGDVVTLRQGGTAPAAQQRSGLVDRRRQVGPNTIFLRNEGYIEDESDAVWGELNSSREDKTFLSDFDEVYMRIFSDRDLKVGQELQIFRPVRNVSSGKIVEIQGTVRIDQWNPKERIARGRIIETTDTIERGARIGPLQRRYDIVPPVRNDQEVKTRVLASLSPHMLYGQNQIVFVDAGKKAGLVPGNRLFIVRKGDGFHKSLPSSSAAKRIALESDAPAEVQTVPGPKDDAALPEEVEAELRVVSVREGTALCLVMNARREIESGDLAVARKGY